MYRHPLVGDNVVFRGGTALHKLFFERAGRYSEDIDLVQREAGPIGGLVDAIREALDPWLGKPKWKQGRGRFTLYYRFETTFVPVVNMRLKVEINTREHFNVLGINRVPFVVENPWFQGTADVATYAVDELLATKLRALYQRKKGRDLFDVWYALSLGRIKPATLLTGFARYMNEDGRSVTRAQFEENLTGKRNQPDFRDDVIPLLRPGITWDFDAAMDTVLADLVACLPGDPWKGEERP